MDFVEEDVSRKLPASERVNHTLLAINYGAILALLVPVLARLGAPSRPRSCRSGTASAACWRRSAAVGVIVFGLRDFFAARRAAAARPRPRGRAGRRACRAGSTCSITGATGFIGRRLVEALVSAGHEVTVLARDPAKAASLRPPFRLVTSLDQIAGDTAIDAIINFAGEPIANGLWTRRKRRRILASRLRMTRAVVRLIGAARAASRRADQRLRDRLVRQLAGRRR